MSPCLPCGTCSCRRLPAGGASRRSPPRVCLSLAWWKSPHLRVLRSIHASGGGPDGFIKVVDNDNCPGEPITLFPASNRTDLFGRPDKKKAAALRKLVSAGSKKLVGATVWSRFTQKAKTLYPSAPSNMDEICSVCGRRYGNH